MKSCCFVNIHWKPNQRTKQVAKLKWSPDDGTRGDHKFHRSWICMLKLPAFQFPQAAGVWGSPGFILCGPWMYLKVHLFQSGPKWWTDWPTCREKEGALFNRAEYNAAKTLHDLWHLSESSQLELYFTPLLHLHRREQIAHKTIGKWTHFKEV